MKLLAANAAETQNYSYHTGLRMIYSGLCENLERTQSKLPCGVSHLGDHNKPGLPYY